MSARILTGMRPTGALHLGHYYGALESWLALQEEHECFFLIADYQALGDYAEDVELIRDAVRQVTLDWLAVGLDPERSTFVVQSYVPEHAELTLLLSMVAKYKDLAKNPTLKSEIGQLEQSKKAVTMGFFNYPVSQVADILLPKATLVPVGDDQAPHIEYTNKVGRDFNRTYGAEVFAPVEARVGRVPRLLGTDGQAKMSKSRGNGIELRDPEAKLRKKIRSMVSDLTGEHPRLSATDPGVPEYNPAFLYFDAVLGAGAPESEDLKEQYRAGTVSDGAVKDRLFELVNGVLAPIRERRAELEQDQDRITEILREGSKREQAVGRATLAEVRDAMRITDY